MCRMASLRGRTGKETLSARRKGRGALGWHRLCRRTSSLHPFLLPAGLVKVHAKPSLRRSHSSQSMQAPSCSW